MPLHESYWTALGEGNAQEGAFESEIKVEGMSDMSVFYSVALFSVFYLVCPSMWNCWLSNVNIHLLLSS